MAAQREKRRVFAVDTEDDSNGNVKLIIFYDGKDYFVFRDCDAAVRWLSEYSHNALCFAVNLEYDLLNLFKGRYEKVRWVFSNRVISARFGKFLFYDTLNHWKMSVAAMGEYIGLPKLKFNPDSIRYCKRDVKITYDFVMRMIERYAAIDMKVKPTLPSSVYDYWLRTYCDFRITRLPRTDLDTWKQAYYGGRTECFYIGDYRKAVRVVDVNSLYPYVMMNDYPYPFDYYKGYDINAYGVTKAKVEVSQVLPVLPYRSDTGKLLYPNGVFTGWWSNDEIRYAISCGGVKILKVYDSYTFPVKCSPFKDFVQDFYARRHKAKDELTQYTYKIAMNSLYGKFGQGNEHTTIKSFNDFLDDMTEHIDMRRYGDLIIYKDIGEYPINSNMIWALYTTSYARIYLHKYLRHIKDNGTLLYCDTDSIFYNSERPLIDVSDKLGAFKDEGIYKGVEIKLPKLYRLGGKKGKIKAKGVPKDKQEEFFDNDFVTYKKPVKFRESLRRGIQANVWIDVPKQNNFIYDKGIILKTGFIEPYTLKNNA